VTGVSEPVLPGGDFVRLPVGTRVFVREVAGPASSPAVVLLHGWSASADVNWFAVLGPLGQHHRVVAMDLRGHGHDRRPVHRLRLADCADDVAAVIGALNLDRPILVGYSMGGMVAQLVWRRHPEVVGGLVLCATTSFARLPPLWRWAYQTATLCAAVIATPLPRRCGHLLIDATRWFTLGPPVARGASPFDRWVQRERRRGQPSIVLQAAAAAVAFDSRHWIAEVDVPTAVVVATADSVLTADAQRALAEAIPGASVHHIAGDHRICLTDPDRFTTVVTEACQSVTTRWRARPGLPR
jgi:pimeloyl-ACP methyl ester carboxylesterase